jgi:hypothetical protein
LQEKRQLSIASKNLIPEIRPNLDSPPDKKGKAKVCNKKINPKPKKRKKEKRKKKEKKKKRKKEKTKNQKIKKNKKNQKKSKNQKNKLPSTQTL